MIIFPKEVVLALISIWQADADLDPREVICMTRNIYHEARGEPEKGQIAVAFVTLERVGSDQHPDTICGVIGESSDAGAQFSWVDGSENADPSEWASYEASMRVAINVMTGRVDDPVPGATHFYAYHKTNPSWASKFVRVADIGAHRFMKE